MILGVDLGERRVGLALADLETRFARPLEVIEAARSDVVERIVQLVEQLGVKTVVVGRPIALSGSPGRAVEAQQEVVARLRSATTVEVEEYDERLTTVVAERGLRAGGAPAGTRRKLRDAVAAQVMLQGYLDSRR